ncbi:predicted secreted protein [Weissella oryzae SG25]|uniref:Predicted secreted protein n=1 Tax=Weissella oryzae (strain DSM 25784 / JCM 18191 / LMG 30913 / SG25) TaxID=1329250 RepID=A0A069CSW3_WEIOS|nr:DUF1002 domain-containing protein [Weissella oryzae]GAK30900.1 predicted secreted protein [Weissella oryzae SG25]
MKSKNLIASILVIGTVTTAVTTVVTISEPTLTSAWADTNTTTQDTGSATSATSSQVHTLSKSYVVYGAGASQQSTLSTILGVTNNYQQLTTTGADAAQYLGLSGVADSAMISSVAVAPAEPGTGILVNIKDFNGQNNITQVTSQQYSMAATMAGVKDVIITVSANQPVSGEAALAGVYKALSTDGATIDPTNTTAANNVMSATQSAINANPNDKSYAGKLTSAVTQTAGQVAQKKQDGQTINVNIIINQLNINLQKQGIANKTSDAQVQSIATALQGVADAPISNSSAFVSQAKNLAGRLSGSVGNIMAQAKDFANSADVKQAANWFIANVWNPVVSWFQSIFGQSSN